MANTVQANQIKFPDSKKTYVSGFDEKGSAYGSYVKQDNSVHGFTWINGVYTAADRGNGAISTQILAVNKSGDYYGTYTLSDGRDKFFKSTNGIIEDIKLSDATEGTISINGITDDGNVYGVYQPARISDRPHMVGFVQASNGKKIEYDVTDAMWQSIIATKSSNEILGWSGGVSAEVNGNYLLSEGVYRKINYPDSFITIAMGFTSNGGVFGTYFNKDDNAAYSFIESDGNYEKFTVSGRDIASGKNFSGVTSTRLMGYNEDGSAYGTYKDGDGEHIFIYKNGSFRSVDLFPRSEGIMLSTADGDKFSGGFIDKDGKTFGFSRGVDGIVSVFEIAPTNPVAVAFGLSPTNKIHGGYFAGRGGEAFVLDGASLEIIEIPNANFQIFTKDVNNTNAIVGEYYVQEGKDYLGKAYVWQNKAYRTIELPINDYANAYSDQSWQLGINDRNKIFGGIKDEGVIRYYIEDPLTGEMVERLSENGNTLKFTNLNNDGSAYGTILQTDGRNLPFVAAEGEIRVIDFTQASNIELKSTNVNGDAVGQLSLVDGGNNYTGSFYYSFKNNSVVKLNVPGSEKNWNGAWSLDKNGVVFGNYYDSIAQINKAYYATPTNSGGFDYHTFTLDLPNLDWVSINAANSSGAIAGHYQTKESSGNQKDGVFANTNGQTNYYDFPGMSNVHIKDINNDGVVIGGYYDGSEWRYFAAKGSVIREVAYPAAQANSVIGFDADGNILGSHGGGSATPFAWQSFTYNFDSNEYKNLTISNPSTPYYGYVGTVENQDIVGVVGTSEGKQGFYVDLETSPRFLVGGKGHNEINGTSGNDTSVYSADSNNYVVRKVGGVVTIAGPDGYDVVKDVPYLKFADTVIDVANLASDAAPIFGSPNTDVGYIEPTVYTGPVDFLQYQALGGTLGDVVIGANTNDFMNLSAGDDAADGGSGRDVLDGGIGSSFLTGGADSDVFFVDGRNAVATWSTITDFSDAMGDTANMWGWRPGTSQLIASLNDGGAAGYTGATYHYDLDGNGGIDTSITFTGLTTAQVGIPTANSVAGNGYLLFS